MLGWMGFRQDYVSRSNPQHLLCFRGPHLVYVDGTVLFHAPPYDGVDLFHATTSYMSMVLRCFMHPPRICRSCCFVSCIAR